MANGCVSLSGCGGGGGGRGGHVFVTSSVRSAILICNTDNKSSGNKGTQHDPARLIVCKMFLRRELTLSTVDLE